MSFSIHSVYRVAFRIWRKKRFASFVEAIPLSLTDQLLDVGGYPHFWTHHPRLVGKIDTLNVHEVEWNAAEAPEHNISTLLGDGCCLAFADGSYDIVFSNSVIEHVGPWEKQQAFAAEARRVGKSLWVQTPAFECPMEMHFLALGVHWLPMKMRKFTARWLTPWGWLERRDKSKADKFVENIHLLSKKQMCLLFPDCEIRTEKVFGIIPKSYIAIRTP